MVARDHAWGARATTPCHPVEPRMVLLVSRDQLTLGVHQVDGSYVLTRRSPDALIPAHAATEQVATDADSRTMTRRKGQPVPGECRHEFGVFDRRLDGRGASRWVD